MTFFKKLFMMVPYSIRRKLVSQVRQKSAQNKKKDQYIMDVEPSSLIKELRDFKIDTIIHGHTHKWGIKNYSHCAMKYTEYILSDWMTHPCFVL